MKQFDALKKESKPLFVDFYATWCGPCRIMMPIVKELEKTLGDKVNFLKIDVDKEAELASRYHVQSVPTLMIFKNGELVWREVGVRQAHLLETILERYY